MHCNARYNVLYCTTKLYLGIRLKLVNNIKRIRSNFRRHFLFWKKIKIFLLYLNISVMLQVQYTDVRHHNRAQILNQLFQWTAWS